MKTNPEIIKLCSQIREEKKVLSIIGKELSALTQYKQGVQNKIAQLTLEKYNLLEGKA